MKKISLIILTALASTGLFASCTCSSGSNWKEENLPEATQDQTVYQLNVQKEYLDYIIVGKKIAEGRLNVPQFANAKKGDIINFFDDQGGQATCTVTAIGRYDNFEKMLVSDGVVSMLPQIDPSENTSDEMVDKGVDIYQSFPGYKVGVKIYGAISFGLQYHPEGKDHSTAKAVKVDDRN
ncbi:MAG: hypothetical protein KFB93_01450 [Simkaniaceae bacterium]|nr:MAG: hypothetical protein KFB93_01450 [Simkaniaceae bacterium]